MGCCCIAGLIVAESYRRAREAVKLVKVTYDVSKAPKPVLSLDDAIARKSFFPPYPGTTPIGPFATGDLGKGFAQSKHVLQVRSVERLLFAVTSWSVH